jgi:molybdopterin/thiamine biosynthesis adenylyltransferase
MALARCGVGHIAVADPDLFEASNLNRQVFASAVTLGSSKSEVTCQALREINPTLDVRDLGSEWAESLDSVLSRYPVVVNAMDDTAAGIRLYRAAREHGATVVDAYSAPLPSVMVTRPGDPRPEERLGFPTVGRSIEGISQIDLARARAIEAEYVLTHSSALARFDAAVAAEILSGARPRSSFSTVVTIAGTLMAHEAIALLVGRPTGADARGYFFDPWTGTVERPVPGIGAWLARRRVRRLLDQVRWAGGSAR